MLINLYLTLTPDRGSELMCWYGDDYGKELGLSREPSKWKPIKKDFKGNYFIVSLFCCRYLYMKISE